MLKNGCSDIRSRVRDIAKLKFAPELPAGKAQMRETANPEQSLTLGTAAPDSTEAWILRFFTPARCALIFLAGFVRMLAKSSHSPSFFPHPFLSRRTPVCNLSFRYGRY